MNDCLTTPQLKNKSAIGLHGSKYNGFWYIWRVALAELLLHVTVNDTFAPCTIVIH